MADFNENDGKRQLTLREVFQSPESLDVYRTQVSFQVRLRKVTAEEMEFCKYRTLATAYDYIRALANGPWNASTEGVGGTALAVEDRVLLLRNAFAPLTVFDIATGTMQATKDGSLLCLPTGITVSRAEEIVANSFLSQKLVGSILDTLSGVLLELALDAEERAMLKAVVVLNTDSFSGLTPPAEQFVRDLRDRVHTALYQHCTGEQGGKQAAVRFAKLLHLLPKLTLLARDLVEHMRMCATFPTESHSVDPLFFQLFGDIFQAEEAFIAPLGLDDSPTMQQMIASPSSSATATSVQTVVGPLRPARKFGGELNREMKREERVECSGGGSTENSS